MKTALKLLFAGIFVWMTVATIRTSMSVSLWDAAPAVKKLTPLAAPLAKEKLPALWATLGEGDAAQAFEVIRDRADITAGRRERQISH